MEQSPRQALASLLPLLLAGEVSAASAFHVLGRRRRRQGDDTRLLGALETMGADERWHERLLLEWQQELPVVSADPELERHMRVFFRGLASRDAGVHFARIAALDSAVCLLLGSLRRAQPLPMLGPLWQIASDEARHVVVARDYALALTCRAVRLAAADETRTGLARLLAFRGDALDALDLDVDRLLGRLSRPPRCLC
jgi:hypothetical protein